MLRILFDLLGAEARVLRRYLGLALLCGLVNGLTIAALAPLMLRLLEGDDALPWLAALLGGMILSWLCRRRVEMAGVDVGLAVLGAGRERIGDHVARLPMGWFTCVNTTRLNHLITHGMTEVAQFPAHVLTPVITGMVVPVVVALALFASDWRMGVLALAALPILAGVFVASARFGRDADAAWHDSAAATSRRTVEFARNQPVLRAFGAGSGFLHDAIEGQHASSARLIRMSLLSVVLNSWVVQAIFGGLLLIGASRAGPEMLAATSVALVLAVRFVEPLLDVAGYGQALRGARNHLDVARTILSARPLPEPDRPQMPANGSVEVRNLSFGTVLEGVSFRAEAGEMIALVGASGSGKTTLLRLVARFFDADRGQVEIGGVDVRDIGAQGLTATISQIFQDSWLFSGTVADNIRLGRPDADDDDLAEAVRLAGLEEMIAHLPDGLHTHVGEGGSRLSGGERQRVAIARALLKAAPVLLVDEATSALDPANEAAVARTLAGLRGHCTLIVAAHRLSTLRMADRIVVLDHGRVVEQGAPAELMAQGGAFARLSRQRVGE